MLLVCVDGINLVSGIFECIFKNFGSLDEKVVIVKLNYSNVLFEIFKYFGGYISLMYVFDGI